MGSATWFFWDHRGISWAVWGQMTHFRESVLTRMPRALVLCGLFHVLPHLPGSLCMAWDAHSMVASRQSRFLDGMALRREEEEASGTVNIRALEVIYKVTSATSQWSKHLLHKVEKCTLLLDGDRKIPWQKNTWDVMYCARLWKTGSKNGTREADLSETFPHIQTSSLLSLFSSHCLYRIELKLYSQFWKPLMSPLPPLAHVHSAL